MAKGPIETAVEKAESIPAFTEEEITALKEMAAAWKGLESFGRVAGFARRVLAYIGWMIAAYVAFKFAISEWVKGLPR